MRGSKIDSEPPLWVAAILFADRWKVPPWLIWEDMTPEWYGYIMTYDRIQAREVERRSKRGKK